MTSEENSCHLRLFRICCVLDVLPPCEKLLFKPEECFPSAAIPFFILICQINISSISINKKRINRGI